MTSLRFVIGRLLQRTPYRVLREDRVPQCTANLLALGAKLALTKGTPDRLSVIVQVGAFDGQFADGLEPIIRRPGAFVALLVEPQPGPFAKIQSLYQGRNDVLAENAAITESDREVELFSDQAGATPFATILPDRAKIIQAVSGSLRSITVRGLTVDSLLAKHGVTSVDVLTIDTEGFDLVILRQFLQCLATPPQVVQLESHHLSREDRVALRSLLMEHGYHYADTHQDTIAFQRALLTDP